MFKPGAMYRFKANRDVGFEVIKGFYVKETHIWKLRVLWYNIGSSHDPWPMGIQQNVAVHTDNMINCEQVSFRYRVPKVEFLPVHCKIGVDYDTVRVPIY